MRSQGSGSGHSVLLATAGLILALLALPDINRAAPSGLQGHWEGAIEIPGQPLQVDLDFSQQGDSLKGDVSIPAQNAKDLPLKNIRLDGDQASFSIAGIPGNPTFQGVLSGDGKSIKGGFTQSGQTISFSLTSGMDPAAKAAQALAGLGGIIEPALKDWKTPGLGLAVVVDGKVVLAQGYGYRDLEAKLPVTARTLFAIGSSTKAFTTFALGTLVDEGKVNWDKPVREYIPDFKLYDEYASAHITPRDLVTHRSGLPRHDLVWYNNDTITRAELVHRLRDLKPNRELREQWQYNNLMFLTAGYLIEQVTGQTWEDAVRSRILEPLGMSRTNFSVQESQRSDDFARPYLEDEDVVRKVAFRPINVMGPAGSINSCVEEMAQWLLVHLGDGRIGDRQIIQPSTLTELHTPQMVIQGLPREPENSPSSYAFGWFVDTWRGHFHVSHGGSIDGFSALVTLYPNDHVGVVALSNMNGDALPALITKTVADRVLGLEPKDWIGEAAVKRDEGKKFAKAGEAKKDLFRKKDTKPSHPLKSLAGDYHNPGYGTLEVREQGRSLVMKYNGMDMPLEHWHYDTFTVPKSDKEIIPEDQRVVFQTDAGGEVSGLTVPFEPMVDPILFGRLPDRKLSDPDYLKRLAGEYKLPGDRTATVALKGSALTLQVQGQPAIELVPSGADEFKLKDLTGFSVRFTVAAEGPASEALIIQPNGVFTLKRTEK